MLKFGCKTIAMFKNNNFGNGGPSMVHPGGGNNGTNPSPLLQERGPLGGLSNGDGGR